MERYAKDVGRTLRAVQEYQQVFAEYRSVGGPNAHTCGLSAARQGSAGGSGLSLSPPIGALTSTFRAVPPAAVPPAGIEPATHGLGNGVPGGVEFLARGQFLAVGHARLAPREMLKGLAFICP